MMRDSSDRYTYVSSLPTAFPSVAGQSEET